MKPRILVTGGSRGIGRAIVEELGNRSEYQVIAPSRSELDLLDDRSIAAYLEKLEPVDGLVNTAGINILGKLDELSGDAISAMLNTNLVAN